MGDKRIRDLLHEPCVIKDNRTVSETGCVNLGTNSTSHRQLSGSVTHISINELILASSAMKTFLKI